MLKLKDKRRLVSLCGLVLGLVVLPIFGCGDPGGEVGAEALEVEAAQSDAVPYWNEITLSAVSTGRSGPTGPLDIALVQAAVHDAVQAIEGRFEPYYATIPGASGSTTAAVAAAAHGVLVGLYPPQQASLTTLYDDYVNANGLVGDPGLAVGQQAAAALLTQYRPVIPMPPFNGPPDPEPGEWRPTPSYIGNPPVPPAFAPMAAPYFAFVTPFTMDSPSQFRPHPPPPLTSGRYRREYDEVKALGARFNSDRTPEQTDLAYFWADNFFAQWNRALRAIAREHLSNDGDSARLFALANLAMADAGITAWDSKLHFNFWRPVTAIQEGDNDGNEKTVGDPAWEPLINTPNYPDYTSGANNFTGAVTTILRLFFGTDEFDFTVTSNNPNATTKTRIYSRFSEAAAEVVEARILLGIHFRTADEVARKQGSRVARQTFKQFLRPVHGCGWR
jgi:hypothetical protein